jgi:hypothetical protein
LLFGPMSSTFAMGTSMRDHPPSSSGRYGRMGPYEPVTIRMTASMAAARLSET